MFENILGGSASIPVFSYVIISIYLIITITLIVASYTNATNYIPEDIVKLHASLTSIIVPVMAYYVVSLPSAANTTVQKLMTGKTAPPAAYY